MKLKKRRTNFTPEEKVTILRERLIEGVPVNELCTLYGIQPSQYYNWQRQLFKKGIVVFQHNSDSRLRSLEQENTRLREKIHEKDEVIAEVIQEYVKLKKEV